jgi:anti-anti-sigma factor
MQHANYEIHLLDARIDEASRHSFPASDPPPWWGGLDREPTTGSRSPTWRAEAERPSDALRVTPILGRGATRLRVVGELDVATRGRLARAVQHALRRDIALLVLDLQDVTFIDAAGLRAVTGAIERSAGSGVQCEVLPGPQLRRIVALAGESLTGSGRTLVEQLTGATAGGGPPPRRSEPPA